MRVHYERHVFVCTNRRAAEDSRGCCAAKNSEEIRAMLKVAVKAAGLSARVRINGAGCLDFCHFGACLAVYPENVWYGRVTKADVEEIVREHFVNGRPVMRLRITDAELLAPKPWK